MKSKFFFTVMALLMGLCSYSFAQVPQLINYQGKLTNASGAPITDTLPMIFTIYSDTGGTTPLWTETQPAVVVEKGVFNVILGSVDSIPYSVFDGSIRYLGVKVGSDPEITPRKPMVSVAYAYRASSGGGGSDDKWKFRITDTADTSITTRGNWGIARYGATLYGDMDSTHVNLGVSCTTGTSTHSNKYCTVAGGILNTASGSAAFVGGGGGNIASGFLSAVVGGDSNMTSGDFAIVGGGYRNTASGTSATVGGGERNIASGWLATVGGGYSNTASNPFATVGGGFWNTASGDSSTIGGGVWNTANAPYAMVGGGWFNIASGEKSTVGGGQHNTASYPNATVAGGNNNTASHSCTAIGGGCNNIASGYGSTVGGGGNNTASGSNTIIAGGNANTASGSYATVGGGWFNTASGDYSVVAGGYADTAAGEYSFACGDQVKLTSGADFTFAYGRNFTTSTPNAVIFYNPVNPMRLGVGTVAPNTVTDINGDVATRGGSFVASDGYNDNISIGQRSFVRITGPTVGFTITGIAGGQDGKIVILYNATDMSMAIANESAYSNASNRILTMSGANETTVGTGNVTLIYDTTGQRWIVTAIKP